MLSLPRNATLLLLEEMQYYESALRAHQPPASRGRYGLGLGQCHMLPLGLA